MAAVQRIVPVAITTGLVAPLGGGPHGVDVVVQPRQR